MAAAVRQGLSQYDLDKALRVERLRYVAEYDPELAKRLATLPSLNAEDAANGMSTEDRVRLQQIYKLADYERDWISKNQDKPLVINGPFGKSFRSTRLAKQEAKDSQERREMIGVLAVGLGGAALGAAAGATSGALNAVQTVALQTTAQVAQGMAMNLVMSDPARAQSDFYSHFGAEIAARDQVLDVTINDKVIKVNASNREALRNDLKRAYQEANAVH